MDKRTGQRFGSYSLVRLLGRGSISEVYLGEHVERKTQAAIKILQMKLSASDQASFLTQTRSLSQLKHPNIVSIWEAGIRGNAPFLAMTYAPHGSLRIAHPPGKRLPQEQLLSYVQQITAALQYLHDQQLIYRDLRPHNLLLGVPNNTLLADFALSLVSQSSRSLNMQEMMGDVTYMAPEQLQGKPCPASDQYALGIIVYEWLSGNVPFVGTFTEVANQHAFTPPALLHAKVPEIAPAVEEVVQIALSKEPQWRFASVRAFSNAFEQACQRNQPPLEARTFRVPERLALPTKPGDLQKSAPSKQPVAQLSSDSMQLSTPQTLPSLTPHLEPARPRRSLRKSIMRTALGILALLVIVSAGGFALWQHSTQTEAQNAGSARTAALTATVVQAHLQATTITRAYANTEATAEAAAKAEEAATVTAMQNLYTQTTQGTATMNDQLTANDSNRWDEGLSTKHESCAFIGGAYHVIEPQISYSSLYPCFANAIHFSNFAFQVQVKILKGDMGGLVFLADDAHANYCYFGLYDPKNYQFQCNNNFTTLNLSSPQSTTVGNQSPQINLLTIIVRNQHIFLYINKQYIGDTKESFFTTGEIGVFAQASSNATEVAFNNAQVWRL